MNGVCTLKQIKEGIETFLKLRPEFENAVVLIGYDCGFGAVAINEPIAIAYPKDSKDSKDSLYVKIVSNDDDVSRGDFNLVSITR